MSTARQYATLRSEANAHLKAARDLADQARDRGRDLSDDETATAYHHINRANEITPKLRELKSAAKNEAALKDQLTDLSQSIGLTHGGYGTPAAKGSRGKAWGRAVVDACSDGVRYKGITPSGSVVVAVPAPQVAVTGRPLPSLRNLLPTEQSDG
jgi:hypothetical protein